MNKLHKMILDMASRTEVVELNGFPGMDEGTLFTYSRERAEEALEEYEHAKNCTCGGGDKWHTFFLIDDETTWDKSYTHIQVAAPDEETAILLGILRYGLWNDYDEIGYHQWAPGMVVAGKYPGLLQFRLEVYTDNDSGPCLDMDSP